MAAGKLIRVTGRRQRRRGPTVRSVNRKVNRIISQIERKRFIGEFGLFADNAGTVTWVSAITLGDTDNAREGVKVSVKSFKFKYGITFAAASTHDDEYVRVMVLIDKSSQGILALPVNILSVVNTTSYPPRGLNERFRVLFDKTHVLNRMAALAIDTATPVTEFKKSMRNMKMTFNIATPVPASGVGGEKNQIIILVVTNAAANGAAVNGSTELIYSDL